MNKKVVQILSLLAVISLLAACGPTPEPQTIVQTVEVEKTVVETVEVEKEVEVVVTQEVEVVVTQEVEKEVVKEVVKEEVEVTRVVEVEGETVIETVIEETGREFTGDPITLNVKDAELEDVLAKLADFTTASVNTGE